MKLIRILTLVSLATGMAVLGACGTSTTTIGIEVPVDGGIYRSITPAELNSLMQEDTLYIVNVDDAYTGEIPGTNLFLPSQTFTEHMDELPSDKATPIVVYCLAGQKSSEIAGLLVENGILLSTT